MIHIVKIFVGQAAQLPAVKENRAWMLFARLPHNALKFVKPLPVVMFYVAFSRGHEQNYRADVVAFAQRQVVVQNLNVLCAGVGENSLRPRVDFPA